MPEEDKPAPAPTEPAPTSKPEEPKPAPKDEDSEIEKAEKLVAQMKEENEKTSDLLKRQESLHAKQVLGGRGEAGQPGKTEHEVAVQERKDKWDDAGLNPFKGEGEKALGMTVETNELGMTLVK